MKIFYKKQNPTKQKPFTTRPIKGYMYSVKNHSLRDISRSKRKDRTYIYRGIN